MKGQIVTRKEGSELQQIIQTLINEAPQVQTPQGQQGPKPPEDQHAYNEWVTRVDLLLTEVAEGKRELLTERLDTIRKRAAGSAHAYLTPDVLDVLKGMSKAVDDGTLP